MFKPPHAVSGSRHMTASVPDSSQPANVLHLAELSDTFMSGASHHPKELGIILFWEGRR